jgi:putative transposase
VARRPREFAAGVYHVAAHGSSHRRIFLDDSDRRSFLDLLNIVWAQLGLELISYVLMTNHYHSLTWIPDKRLSTALKMLHGQYSARHNKRHRDSVHLFRAHCFARRLGDDGDLLSSEHYLAHNPVKAGIVLKPVDWPMGEHTHPRRTGSVHRASPRAEAVRSAGRPSELARAIRGAHRRRRGAVLVPTDH